MIRWLSANWVWLLLAGAMLWMHLGMHHGRGGHSRHAHGDAQVETGTPHRSALNHEGDGEPESEPASTGGHRHRDC